MQNCINHTGAKAEGYGVVKRKGRLVRAHRLAYCESKKITLDEIKGFVVMHKCDNRSCINPDHLSLGSHADNCKDKVSKGRQAKGEKVGNSKLKNEEVKLIRLGFSAGLTNKFLAKKFSVSEMCISRIRSGKTWRHI